MDQKHHATHELLRKVAKILPTDYNSYGGNVERWQDEDRAYPDCSCGCKWAVPLEGHLGFDWCVCTNENSPRVGLLTFEHQAGFGCFEQKDQSSQPN